MRPSKTRSRNKSNRQRSLGNVVNRVFDSSGPEGKVRGTPQQIIEKYLTLARDAQLGSDRVAEQSFLQHAEHYTRLLGEAQREQAERQQQYQGNRADGDEQPRQNRDDRQRDDQRRDNGDSQPRQNHSGRQSDQQDLSEQQPDARSSDEAFPLARDVSPEQADAAVAEPVPLPQDAGVEAQPARKPRSAPVRRTTTTVRAPRTRKPVSPTSEADNRDPEPAPDAASVE